MDMPWKVRSDQYLFQKKSIEGPNPKSQIHTMEIKHEIMRKYILNHEYSWITFYKSRLPLARGTFTKTASWYMAGHIFIEAANNLLKRWGIEWYRNNESKGMSSSKRFHTNSHGASQCVTMSSWLKSLSFISSYLIQVFSPQLCLASVFKWAMLFNSVFRKIPSHSMVWATLRKKCRNSLTKQLQPTSKRGLKATKHVCEIKKLPVVLQWID